MRSKRQIVRNMLVVVVSLLPLAYFYSCAVGRVPMDESKVSKTDSVKETIPTHPPVVIPHSWYEGE